MAGVIDRLKTLLPGLALVGLCTALAFGTTAFIPLVSAMLIAIIIGMVVRNVGLVPESAEAGLAFAGRPILRTGVVLLGLRLSVPQILELGWGVVGVIALTVAGTYLVTLVLGRFLQIPRAVTVLTATGTAICGAAAVAAMSAVIKTDEESELQEAAATAIASVTLFGTLALVVVPWIGHQIGLSPNDLGIWVGAAIHEVGQVVAGAGIAQAAQSDPVAGQALVDTALVTKLGRVVLLAPLVAIVGALESRRLAQSNTTPGTKTPIVPLFVLGFLAMVIVRSVTNIPGDVIGHINTITTVLFTMAMVAMGAGVRINNLLSTGSKSLALGAIAGIISTLLSLAGIIVLV